MQKPVWLERLERISSRTGWALMAGLLLILLALLDNATGIEIAFSPFYLLPVVIMAWFWGRIYGLAMAALAAIGWLEVDLLTGPAYSSELVPYWNCLIRFGSYVIVVLLLSALQDTLRHAQALARIDSVTGALNARAFSDLLHGEIERCRRTGRPFTLAYCDLDNFKTINDRFGHQTGDDVLRAVASTLRGNLRLSDAVARLGGDEFCVLLIETAAPAARTVIERLRQCLLDEMKLCGWPVTFSIGAVTFEQPPASADEAIQRADGLMYKVKRDTKNGVRYESQNFRI